MTSAILHNLARATHLTAHHPDPAFRFWMAVGLFCDLSLQNDVDGVFIALEAVLEFDATGRPDEMDVPFTRDAAGVVVDIRHHEADYTDHSLVELAREIALLENPEMRLVLIEAACLRLFQDKDDNADDLLAKATRARAQRLSIHVLGIPLAQHARFRLFAVAADPRD
ncbi:hypothetical protein [Brevundimonas sp. DC300-4]|uniref:hypothetical protein n=1 Tax=Brevundimonas sp. DC300-4 TaxID=2804594 RepID=UPI003CF822A8